MELAGSVPCYNVYRTKDGGFITLAALEPKFWSRFLHKIERMDLMEEQLAKGDAFEKAYGDLQRVFLTKTRKEWMEFFGDEDVCVGPVNEIDELLDDPHIDYRGMFGYVALDGGRSLTIKNPFYPDRQRTGFMKAPKPGEHTVDVLSKAGYADDQIDKLKQKGVI